MHWRTSDLIDALASERRTGLVFVDEYGHRRDYTFTEIAAHSQRYAAVLRALGVKQDDRVYVSLSTTAKTIFTLLAIERLGAAPILSETGASGATTIISSRKFRSKIDHERESFSRDARYLIIGEEREGWARLDTLAQIATPIAAAGTLEPIDEALEHARSAAAQHLGAVATDVVWCALQIGDPDWFSAAVTQPWLLGAATVAHDGAFDARERLDLVRELDVTVLLQQSDEYHAELALPDPKRFKMPRLRRCIILGEGYDELLQQQWTERFGVRLTPDGDRSTQTA